MREGPLYSRRNSARQNVRVNAGQIVLRSSRLANDGKSFGRTLENAFNRYVGSVVSNLFAGRGGLRGDKKSRAATVRYLEREGERDTRISILTNIYSYR